MRLIRILSILLASGLATGCASTRGYLLDRGRDAADIVTATVGCGLGAKVRVSCLNVGAYAGGDIAGLRGGTLFNSSRHFFALDSHAPGEFTCPLWLPVAMVPMTHVEHFDDLRPVSALQTLQSRGKTFEAFSVVPFVSIPKKRNWPYATQIDVAAGVLGGVRLGLNPGELLDFFLGWATLDIFNDDLEKRRKSNKPLHYAHDPRAEARAPWDGER